MKISIETNEEKQETEIHNPEKLHTGAIIYCCLRGINATIGKTLEHFKYSDDVIDECVTQIEECEKFLRDMNSKLQQLKGINDAKH